MRFLSLTLLLCMSSLFVSAAKQHYIPQEWRNSTSTKLYAQNDPNNEYTWSESRSVESDNIIIYWDNGYGNTTPSNAENAYQVDIWDLLQKCEAFFDLEINQLGFVDPDNSNLNKYKVMVLLNHSTEWICYGGGYDFQVSAIWLSPSTCKPVGTAVAHEIGHSFHYMCYAEASKQGTLPNVQTGFHGAVGNGSVTWEQTAQWQSLQTYPEAMFTESINVFRNSHNLAFTHEWHRYQSYWFFYYLTQNFGLRTIANVWNYNVNQVLDFNQVLMRLQNWSVNDLFRHYYNYAAHCVTWDWDACEPYRDNFIGDLRYAAALNDNGEYQVAYSSCPQSTGFNAVPLTVPAAGTVLTTTFKALNPGADLADGDPAQYLNGESVFASSGRTTYNSVNNASSRGFRLGYVALLNDGNRVYSSNDNIYCQGTGETSVDVSFTVPNNVSKLWFMVVPAPSTYFQHQWDESPSNDDQWPYTLSFNNTDIDQSKATLYVEPTLDGRDIQNVTLTYDVYFPASSDNYTGTSVSISGTTAAALGTAFQMNVSDIASKMVDYNNSGPGNDKIMFYAAYADGSLIESASTANGYGHWFTNNGGVTDWGSNSFVFSEFNPSTLTFTIGQMPNLNSNGQTRTIAQALVYNDGSKTAKAVLVFNIHFDENQTSSSLTSIELDEPEEEREIENATMTYDVYFPAPGEYTGTTVTIDGSAASTLGTAFQMNVSAIASKMVDYSTSGPGDGAIMFYAANADGSLIESASTANGYGHWFTNNGGVTNWGSNSYVFSEFNPSTLTFTIGQMPDLISNGQTCTIAQALVYNDGSKTAKAVFVFNIHFDENLTGATLTSADFEVVLENNADNTDDIVLHEGEKANVTLNGRTLYKDGAWNTICVPFDVTVSESILVGATVKTLESTSFSHGTLTMYFTEGSLDLIEAGKPYIIKWNRDENLVNPVFKNVTIKNTSSTVATDYANFEGSFLPINYQEADKTVLYLSDDNTLYYPQNGFNIGAFRCRFQLADDTTAGDLTSLVNAFVLNFGDETTSIENVQRPRVDGQSDSWYTIDGCKLNAKPTQKGIYINNGRKVVIE
ncbi:MAG: DUF4859 domain-containing protein [Bacteroidaceae bacterium]|nr:DUF4859 domain-containing protein [Bacteroidaceae bacterium]